MFQLTIERLRDGQSLVMTQNEDKWQLTEVDGLEVPEINISNYEVASMDGVRISSIRMPDRDIIVTLALKGNVDDNRRQIHNLMRVRSVMRLHFVTDSRRVYIDGYLKSIISNRFSELTMMDLTFNCPDPYFKDETGVKANMSREYGQWVFPFPFPGKKWPNKKVEIEVKDEEVFTDTIPNITSTNYLRNFQLSNFTIKNIHDIENYKWHVKLVSDSGYSREGDIITFVYNDEYNMCQGADYDPEVDPSPTDGILMTFGANYNPDTGETSYNLNQFMLNYYSQYANESVRNSPITCTITVTPKNASGSTSEVIEYFAMPVSIIDALRTATITSVSENETGIIIEITFRAAADSVRIVNADTGSMFTVSGYEFEVGDVLTINTIDGQKAVTLLRNSVETSLMAYVVDGSDFFQLQSGDNSFNYIIGGDVSLMADVEFIFTPIYFAI